MAIHRNVGIGSWLWVAGCLLAAWAAPAAAADAPPQAQEAAREEMLREIRRLEEEVQRLQSQIDLLRKGVLPQVSAVVTVPAGSRQGIPSDQTSPSFGPSEWLPEWGPNRHISPQVQYPSPQEPPPPLDSPLDFPQFVPGRLLVRHGLGPNGVTVTLEVLSSDGRVNLQVDPNRLVLRTSDPPDGSFVILNYFELPITVRWVARRSAD
ncbi:MAG TPA: hypothetical protein VED18_00910 [Candidatus Sulfotelmatobacter sp.]|nr:hypothetical protein [Candidatus Sulfotelmatobacter sp.]